MNYRSLSKLKSTYVDALPELVNPETKRLHTSLNQTVAATGRLSHRAEFAKYSGEGRVRITNQRSVYRADRPHLALRRLQPDRAAHPRAPVARSALARRVCEGRGYSHGDGHGDFRLCSSSQITRDMRRVAKTVVFGIVYGISPFGLASNIGVSQADAKKYIETFFERFAAVRALMDRNIEEGKTKGYTTTILGRRRPIPELQSGDPVQRGFGERLAVNSPDPGLSRRSHQSGDDQCESTRCITRCHTRK